MTNSKINYNGKIVHYYTAGKGHAVVLLHGFLEDLHIWDNFVEHLSQNYKVIAIDLPGHGESELQSDVQSMELMANIVDYVITKENLKQICLIGHSMGGYVTMTYARIYPEKIKGIGLFHSSASGDTSKGIQNRLHSIELIEKNHNHFMHSFIPDLFTEKHRVLLEKDILLLQKKAALISKECLLACQKGMIERQDAISIIQKSYFPIMYIIGKQDPRSNFENIIQQASLGKHVEILLLENCGHMGFLEQPDKTLNFTTAFVSHCF